MSKQYRSCWAKWDKEVFCDIHQKDFLFIRETELLTLDEHVEVIDHLVTTTDFAVKSTYQGGFDP